MALKIIQTLLICFSIAVLLNVANFVVCYYIHVNNISNKKTWAPDVESPTTTKWDDALNTLLICDANSSNCPNGLFSKEDNIEAGNISKTSKMFNGFYYSELDIDVSNTRLCRRVPPGLGPIDMDEGFLDINFFEAMFSYIDEGGMFKPMQCTPRQSVAVIVPMRDVNRSWKNFIGTFLFYIHLFLMKQLVEYQVFLILQEGNPRERLARGKLLNAGYIEAQKMRRNGWDCLIFHDANYIATNTRNLHRCTRHPRRLIALSGNPDKFGGIVAIRPSIFSNINGFSNLDWQNDGDYENMYQRLSDWNYTIETTPASIGNYSALKPFELDNRSRSSQRLDVFHATTPIHMIDGLSSLSYRVVNAGLKHLFTFIKVDFLNEK